MLPGPNYVSEQTGTRRSFALHSCCAHVLLTGHHVWVSRGTQYSTAFACLIHCFSNCKKRAHCPSKLSTPGQSPKCVCGTTKGTTLLLLSVTTQVPMVGLILGHSSRFFLRLRKMARIYFPATVAAFLVNVKSQIARVCRYFGAR